MDTIYFKQLTLKASVSVILKFPLKYGKWLLFPLFRFGSFHFAGEYFSQFSTDFENSCSSKILGQNSIKIQIFASIGAFLLSLMDEHKNVPKMVKIPYKFGSFFRIFDLWCGYYSGGLSGKWFQITLILYKCRPKKMLHQNLKVPGTLTYRLFSVRSLSAYHQEAYYL